MADRHFCTFSGDPDFREHGTLSRCSATPARTCDLEDVTGNNTGRSALAARCIPLPVYGPGFCAAFSADYLLGLGFGRNYRRPVCGEVFILAILFKS